VTVCVPLLSVGVLPHPAVPAWIPWNRVQRKNRPNANRVIERDIVVRDE
jgi:hypothetical protein